MSTYGKKYDVIVVGGGHAGCEAALAAARMGCATLLLTMNMDAVALMSCNPAIGGLAKGHLVKEIDALGGEMGLNIDATGIQFRTLNIKKGPAVRATRAQADRQNYRLRMKQVIEEQPNLDLKQGSAVRVILDNRQVAGVEVREGLSFSAKTVILTTGTFMRGLVHVGLTSYSSGRAGEPASEGVSDQLRSLGFRVGRLKTGTPARLDGRTIDFSRLEEQRGDTPPPPFSFLTHDFSGPQISCHITYTNEKTHEIIRGGLDRSPLYTGVIEGVGPRYCPSIEDKVMRFPDKDNHQLFLEPEGLTTSEVYPSGMSTSLPPDVQLAFYRSIGGLEQVEIMRPGYAIEYDFINPMELHPTLETRHLEGLFHAGQINGTSGYEEAAAQGLVAGINAALRVQEKSPMVITRDQGYTGVLIDDLVTKGAEEPYRMFTSRSEYRLLLREDNADLRLTPIGRDVGLVNEERWQVFNRKCEEIETGRNILRHQRIAPADRETISRLGLETLKNGVSLEELLRRPEITIADLLFLDENLAAMAPRTLDQLEISTKYAGYIERQREQVERFRRTEEITVPAEFDFGGVPGLSSEVREKLQRVQPHTLGQASRISGVTPAAIAILSVLLRKR